MRSWLTRTAYGHPVLFATGNPSGYHFPDFHQSRKVAITVSFFRITKKLAHQGEPRSNFMRMLFEGPPFTVLIVALGTNGFEYLVYVHRWDTSIHRLHSQPARQMAQKMKT